MADADGRLLLLVEDNPGDADMIQEMLDEAERGPHRVTIAGSLAGAEAALRSPSLEAVLLDLQLPDGVGVECVRFVRARAPEAPIVVLTGTDDEELALRCLDAGAQDYLTKSEARAQPLRRAIAHAVARVREAAARRQADELRERHAAIVDASSDAILSCTPDGRITSWNRGAERILGYTRGEAVGRLLRELLPAAEGGADPSATLVSCAGAADGGDRVEEAVCRRRDGALVTLSFRGCALRDGSGALVGLAAIGRDVTESRRQERELRRRNEELELRADQMRALTSRLNAIREEERTRIAREVHDELGQLLTGVKMDLRWIARRFGGDVPPPAETVLARLREAEQLVDRAVVGVQGIALELRPSALDVLGLPEAARDEARRFEVRTGIPTEFHVDGDPRPTGEPATAIFRVLQELLTNVMRHAQASRVRIELVDGGAETSLRVEDDGVGARPLTERRPVGLGVLGMRERVEALGGSFDLVGEAGRGTVARVRVPCRSNAENGGEPCGS